MIEKFRLFLAALSVAMLTGCGHNAVVFDKGLGFRAGFDPEHLSADVRFVYGEALTLATRDNMELEWVSDAEGGQEQSAADVKTGSKLRIKIGRQINGAARDLIEAGATAEQIDAMLNGKTEQ
ncbi:MAG: hypothetical protein IIZ83_02240 [Oscillospiraceae bacterium]|nr:hypothetical protein [Oscillospiraceae bacterium]